MKNLFRFAFLGVIVLGFHHSALAQSPFKIGVVDIQEVEQKSMAFEKERTKLQKEVEGMQKRLTADEVTNVAKKVVPVLEQILRETIKNLPRERHCPCVRALKEARLRG